MFEHRRAPWKSWLLRIALVTMTLVSVQPWNALGALAAEPCTCVTYIKSGLGLIPNGPMAAADYGPTLTKIGLKQRESPKKGAIMVFARGVLGGDRTYGHIALVKKTRFDKASGTWSITVQHSKWTVGEIIPGAGPCTASGSVRITTFSGIQSLAGLSFFKERG